MSDALKNVRVRFAPSPTGYLHLGGARTALFNWLFARHHNGKFILRIEDTDEQRSTDEAVGVIIDGLKWLGMDWDEGPGAGGENGPYFQAQRQGIYKKYAETLLKEGKAYLCFCSPSELDEMRKKATASGQPPKYDGRCRGLDEKQAEKLRSEGRAPVIRFRTKTEGTTVVKDAVRGDVTFDNALLDDFVILKSSGMATYNFAVVVDDVEMGITHVIRGDDHISNTPRQLLLYEAMGKQLPVFAHLPMIFGSDRQKLSKRHGAVAVTAYKDEGYLNEAMVNYLALLGWGTPDSTQVFSQEELIRAFSLEGCSKSASIFDFKKLEWLNGEYIRKMSVEELTERAMPFIEKAGIIAKNPVSLRKAVSMEHDKIKMLKEVPSLIDFLFREEVLYEDEQARKILGRQGAKEILEGLAAAFGGEQDFGEKNLELLVRNFCAEKNLKTSEVFHPLRAAVSGRTKGPGLFVMLEFIGKEKVAERIKKASEIYGG